MLRNAYRHAANNSRRLLHNLRQIVPQYARHLASLDAAVGLYSLPYHGYIVSCCPLNSVFAETGMRHPSQSISKNMIDLKYKISEVYRQALFTLRLILLFKGEGS
jgi:hypothetical protein